MLLAAAASVSAMAADTWSLQGTTFTVDTLFHNQVGPGTTSTSLWFRNPANGDALRVFYATMDLTNPYLKLRGVRYRQTCRQRNHFGYGEAQVERRRTLFRGH